MRLLTAGSLVRVQLEEPKSASANPLVDFTYSLFTLHYSIKRADFEVTGNSEK